MAAFGLNFTNKDILAFFPHYDYINSNTVYVKSCYGKDHESGSKISFKLCLPYYNISSIFRTPEGNIVR